MRLSAIIVAAGSSTRVGFDKLFAQIAGRPVIQYSLTAFENAVCVDEIIVVCRETITQSISELIAAARIEKVSALVHGGARRQDSVAAGLDATSPATDFVAVHDAARPLITTREIERVFSAAQQHGAAVLAAPVTDTLKLVDVERFVSGSIDRANVFAMQTPQIFARRVLVDAYRRVGDVSLNITDEVSAVEKSGANVAIVSAEDENIKITLARDLALAEFVLQRRASSS